jgi:hypothetical protein
MIRSCCSIRQSIGGKEGNVSIIRQNPKLLVAKEVNYVRAQQNLIKHMPEQSCVFCPIVVVGPGRAFRAVSEVPPHRIVEKRIPTPLYCSRYPARHFFGHHCVQSSSRENSFLKGIHIQIPNQNGFGVPGLPFDLADASR